MVPADDFFLLGQAAQRHCAQRNMCVASATAAGARVRVRGVAVALVRDVQGKRGAGCGVPATDYIKIDY